NYNDLLKHSLFVSREENGFLGYSLVGAKKGHKVFEKYLDEVPKQFRGDDDLNFQSSMEIFTNLVNSSNDNTIKVLPSDYFFPYNHQTGIINVTNNTRSFHHFFKSWINTTDLLPTISIILPT